jgi:hypothetical protein
MKKNRVISQSDTSPLLLICKAARLAERAIAKSGPDLSNDEVTTLVLAKFGPQLASARMCRAARPLVSKGLLKHADPAGRSFVLTSDGEIAMDGALRRADVLGDMINAELSDDRGRQFLLDLNCVVEALTEPLREDGPPDPLPDAKNRRH